MQLCYFSAKTGLVQYLGNIRPLLEQSDWLILVIGPSILVREQYVAPIHTGHLVFRQRRGSLVRYFGFGEHKEMEKSFTVTRRRNNRITD